MCDYHPTHVQLGFNIQVNKHMWAVYIYMHRQTSIFHMFYMVNVVNYILTHKYVHEFGYLKTH